MKYMLIVLFIFLNGCGSKDGNDNYGYGYHYDLIGETGTRVRYMQGQTTPSLSQIEDLFNQVMTCSSISATGPLVIFVDSLPGEPTIGGRVYYATGTIIIATFGFPDADRVSLVLRHEFLHYLLSQSGYDQGRNSAHDSPLFGTCAEL